MQEVVLPETSIGYAIRTTTGQSLAGTENTYQKPSTFIPVIANQAYYPENPQMVASQINETISMGGSKSFDLRATLASSNPFLSPMIDLERTSVHTIANRIDNPQLLSGTDSGKNNVENFLDETEPTGGSALAKYITRKVTLAQSSVGLRVIFAGNRPDGSEIEVYHKTQEAGADAPFAGLNWVEANIDTVVPSTDDPRQFNDYEYTVDLTSSPFQIVAIKVVFKSQSSTHVPRIKDFRVIALGT